MQIHASKKSNDHHCSFDLVAMTSKKPLKKTKKKALSHGRLEEHYQWGLDLSPACVLTRSYYIFHNDEKVTTIFVQACNYLQEKKDKTWQTLDPNPADKYQLFNGAFKNSIAGELLFEKYYGIGKHKKTGFLVYVRFLLINVDLKDAFASKWRLIDFRLIRTAR